VLVDKEGVPFAVDVFDCNLEAIEASGFGCCDFGGKIAAQVLINDAISGSKEHEDIGDEVAFSFGQLVPICEVFRELNFFSHPERSFGFLVQLPNVGMVDGEEYNTMWVLFCCSGLGAESPMFWGVLCFDSCLGGLGVFLAFLAA
jgi:hypothetical protein